MALVEIARDEDGRIPESLISAAYRASREHAVMLLLDEVTPREVDAILDPVVGTMYREHRGVIYARAGDDSAVLSSASSAMHVFASSDAFRAKLYSWGIRFQDVSQAERMLTA